jgi:hypothetical protein
MKTDDTKPNSATGADSSPSPFRQLHPHINQGPGFSPDGGHLWRKGDKIYWNDGAVVDLSERELYLIRYMPCEHGEDYSLWSDEKRAKVAEEVRIERERYKSEEAIRADRRDALVASAEAKLTEEEIDALQVCYRY